MNFPFYIARRYFFNFKLPGVINLISLISLLGVTVGTFALITVLSVFNGFEHLVVGLFNSFDSDLKIIPAEGKYFEPEEARYDRLAKLENILGITQVIEENALLMYGDNQSVATIKAVEPEYLRTTGIDTMVYVGSGNIMDEGLPHALLGAGVAAKLGVNVYNKFSSVQVYVPDKEVSANLLLNPTKAFNRENIYPGGVFAIQQEFDTKYMVVPLSFARTLLKENRLTAIEINLANEDDLKNMRGRVQDIVGEGFIVKDRFQQHEILYKVMNSEKLAVYLILSFILLISAFNLIGALIMLAIEKRKDMAILKSIGAGSSTIRNIFLFEGMLLASIGAVLGISLGALVCWLQMEYGFVKIAEDSTFVINTYPVKFNITDFVVVFITAIVMGLLASYFPAQLARKKLTTDDLAG